MKAAEADLGVDLAPANPREPRIRNPVIVAAGCGGFGGELADLIDVARIGAVFSPSITARPRAGHGVRLHDAPAGLVYRNDYANPGLRAFVQYTLPIWRRWRTEVIVSIVADEIDDYATMAEELEEVEGVTGIEVNLEWADQRVAGPVTLGAEDSELSPRSLLKKADSKERQADPRIVAEITGAVRGATTLPLITKLGAGDRLVETALAAQEAGADAISVTHGLPAVAVDIDRRGRSSEGRLAGPAIRPVALRAVADVARAVSVPVIGVGGVTTLESIIAMLAAGASAVGVGSAMLVDPGIAPRLAGELGVWLERRGTTLSELIGSARRDPRADDESDRAEPWS